MDHDPLEVAVLSHPHVGAEHDVLAEPGPGLDAAVLGDDRRSLDPGIGVDLGPLPEPHTVLELEPVDLDMDVAVKDVLVGPDVGLERADVLPVAVDHRAEQRLVGVEHGREDIAREVDHLAGRDVVEDLGFEHVDAGVDRVAEHLTPGRLLQEPVDRAVVAEDDDAVLERVLDRAQADGGHGLVLLVELDDAGQVDVGEHVARDDEEPLVEHVLGVADRAGGAHRLLLDRVLDAHAELGAVAEVGPDGAGHVGHGDRRCRRTRAGAAG